MEPIAKILEERGGRYGKYAVQARTSQELQKVIREHMGDKWDTLEADQKDGLQMICVKISRIVNGDPHYADSWADIAGYAKLVSDRIEGTSR